MAETNAIRDLIALVRERNLDGHLREVADEAADELDALRQENERLRRLLWLIVKSNDGYTLERADIESYPGDDMATIARTTDTITGDMTLSAVTNGKRGEAK